MSYDEFDDTTFRERIEAKPRPALVWLAGVAVLVVLELGLFANGVLEAGRAIKFTVLGIAAAPGALAGWVGGAPGTLLYVVSALALLVLGGVVVKWLFVPVTLVDRLGVEVGAGVEDVAERALVTVLLGVAVALLAWTPLGAVVDAVLGWVAGLLESLSTVQTLTSRETIPNQGHRLPGGGWEGPFMGLSPGQAWALRVAVIYAYALTWLGWFWKGYETFREHYREADWTPRDDSIDRMRNHYWGLFGIVVVFMFAVMAIWAPAMSPVTAEENLYSPYEHEVEYLTEDGDVETITHGEANIDTRSRGNEDDNVGLWSYDQYDRFHPFGTNQDGKDLFTFLAYGARVSLVIGLLATGLMAFTATALALLTAYYKGLVDLVTVMAGDAVISLPRFLLVLLLMVLFTEANHPIANLYDGGILLALVFAATGWPFLWRAVRGPSLQVAEEEWIDAAKSFGQSPAATMRKHMSPYIAGYMLVYASLSLGGVIIGVAALSFLGFGVQAPTPEWGRAIYEGRTFVSTPSWHIATIPGILIVLLVTAFNALGDGIRDVIDPQSEAGSGGGAEGAAATGGGG